MANTTFQLKRSAVAGKQPNTSTLSTGELAINTTDQKIYSSNGTAIFEPAANTATLYVGNSTVTAITANSTSVLLANLHVVNSTIISVTGSGQVNAGFLTTGAGGYGNTVGVGGIVVNANIIAIGNSTVNNSINSTSYSGTANNSLYLGGVVAASYVNTTGAYTISGIHTHSSNVVLNNNVNLNFRTLANTSVSLIQQNDDNFVLYSTNTAGSQRAIWSVFANSLTSNFNISVPIQPSGGIYANGSIGTAGQVLASNGSAVFWQTASGTGTVTNIATGNGLTGGPITATGTVSALANTGVVANSTGLFVNATYIAAISSNNASFLGGTAAASYQLNSTLNANIASYLPTYTGVVNAASYTTGATGAGTGGLVANTTVIFFGNNTVNAAINTTALYIGGNVIANSTGANNAFNLGGSSLTTIQTQITSNAATAYTNAVSYTDTKIGTANTAMAANAATAYTNAIAIAANATNLTSGTVAEARLPYRMNQNVSTGNNVTFANIALTGGTITTVPVNTTDIVNKQYADGIATGINFHVACKLATTVTFDATTATYNNGTSGVGATITKLTPFSAIALDGVTAALNDRILMKNVSNTAWNGIYTVTNTGNSTAAWVLTRASDYDSVGSGYNEIDNGDFIYITAGTTLAGTTWVESANVTTIGTDPITFVQFSAKGAYALTGGTGLYYSTGAAYDGSAATTLAVNSSYIATLSANSAAYLGTTIASSFLANTSGGLSQNTSGHFVVAGTGAVVNTTGVHVNATYIGTISANNASYLGGTAAASYALLAGPTFTGTVTTANINSTGVVNAASHTVGTSWVANTSGVYMTLPLTSNGGTGTAGQVLASNGATGAPYWSTISTTTNWAAPGTIGSTTANSGAFTSLGVGTAASGTAGEIRATGDVISSYSDMRLKTKTSKIENALDKVSQLEGFYYIPNQTAIDLGLDHINNKRVGLSAQAVQEVLPEAVKQIPIHEGKYIGKDYLTVQYERVVPLLIEAIKELKEEIRILKETK